MYIHLDRGKTNSHCFKPIRVIRNNDSKTQGPVTWEIPFASQITHVESPRLCDITSNTEILGVVLAYVPLNQPGSSLRDTLFIGPLGANLLRSTLHETHTILPGSRAQGLDLNTARQVVQGPLTERGISDGNSGLFRGFLFFLLPLWLSNCGQTVEHPW